MSDTTQSVVRIAGRLHQAREKRKTQLVAVEGDRNFEGLQRYLYCVHGLSAERRLLRYRYVTRFE